MAFEMFILSARRPDWAACQELAAQVVNASATCARPPCALGLPQPSAGSATFYALTGAHPPRQAHCISVPGSPRASRQTRQLFVVPFAQALLAMSLQ